MKKYIFLAAVAFTAAACGNSSATTCVKGTTDTGVSELFLFYENDSTETIAVKDGKFSFEVPTDVTTIYGIGSARPEVSFIPDGSKISVDMDGQTVVSDKSSVQDRFSKIVEWNKGFSERLRAASDQEERDKIFDDYIGHAREWAKENKDNYIGMSAVISLVGQVEDDEMEELLGQLDPVFDANEDILNLKKAVATRKSTREGCKFVDFEAVQPDGKVLKLSDFVGKGKYILVDFWASWCGPCKREIPNIKEAWKKYKGKKFDVLSVAVWDKPEDTIKAAAELGIGWRQIINAQKTPTDLYGIEGIPHLILFGPDGTIVKRGEALRGEGLDKILKEELK